MQHVQNGLSKDMTKLGSKVSGPRWEAWGEGVKKKIGLAKQVEASSNNLKASPPPQKISCNPAEAAPKVVVAVAGCMEMYARACVLLFVWYKQNYRCVS